MFYIKFQSKFAKILSINLVKTKYSYDMSFQKLEVRLHLYDGTKHYAYIVARYNSGSLNKYLHCLAGIRRKHVPQML